MCHHLSQNDAKHSENGVKCDKIGAKRRENAAKRRENGAKTTQKTLCPPQNRQAGSIPAYIHIHTRGVEFTKMLGGSTQNSPKNIFKMPRTIRHWDIYYCRKNLDVYSKALIGIVNKEISRIGNNRASFKKCPLGG